MSKTALIFGISGQDGALLAKFLLHKGYFVVGQVRSAKITKKDKLIALDILSEVELKTCSLLDVEAIQNLLLDVMPDEIYNLSGQSSVRSSFADPIGTFESHAVAMLNILEATRLTNIPARLFNAGSAECFGDTGGVAANELTHFQLGSPYAVAKAASFWQTRNYRSVYGIFACSGILFNHESVLRPESFVTQKVVQAALRIASGSDEILELGNLSIRRDWGWAPEYVDAMWRMLQADAPEDFVIATGESYSLKDFVIEAFNCVNLNWADHTRSNESLLRPSDIFESKGDASKASDKLGWKAQFKMKDVVRMMINSSKKNLCI